MHASKGNVSRDDRVAYVIDVRFRLRLFIHISESAQMKSVELTCKELAGDPFDIFIVLCRCARFLPLELQEHLRRKGWRV
jgi:hypothetical protein